MLSTLYKNSEVRPDYGVLIFFDTSIHGLAGEERSLGVSVRAVSNTDPTGLKSTILDNTNEIEGIYDLQGRNNGHPQKGLSIIKYKNGVTKKVVVK